MARPITSLHRLSHALVARAGSRVRTTDWWAVLVEIAVVVLGIIIAFELNEWDQQREERQEARQVLRHLGEETPADIAAISSIRDEHRQSAQNYRMLLTAIRDPGVADAYHARGEL